MGAGSLTTGMPRGKSWVGPHVPAQVCSVASRGRHRTSSEIGDCGHGGVRARSSGAPAKGPCHPFLQRTGISC